MGSKKGWNSVGGAVMNVVTGGYYGQKKLAKAQANAANVYAASQKKLAEAISATSQVAPSAVQPVEGSAVQSAEQQVQSANKRRKTMASTSNTAYNNILGFGGGRRTL